MTTGPSPRGDRVPGQQGQLDQPNQLHEPDAGRHEKQDDQEQPPRPARETDGWQILSYMLGGMILYGGIGWLVGKWTGISVLFPVGMILGIGLSIVLIVFRVSKT